MVHIVSADAILQHMGTAGVVGDNMAPGKASGRNLCRRHWWPSILVICTTNGYTVFGDLTLASTATTNNRL